MTFSFSKSNGIVTVTGYSGSVPNGKLVVPSQSTLGPVTIIGTNAFNGNNEIKNVAIEKGITTINTQAFFLCMNLVYISIPETVTLISDHSLRHGNFEDVADLTFTVVFEGNSMLKQINKRAIGTAKNVRVYYCGQSVPSFGSDIFYCASSVIVYSSTIKSFCGVSTTKGQCSPGKKTYNINRRSPYVNFLFFIFVIIC